MTSYLVEAYLPATTDLDDVDQRATRAAQDLSATGSIVRFVRSIYIAEDETCFLVFDAASADAVRLASNRAELRPQRIVEAVEHIGPP
jgi:hypothetical protein